MGQFSVRVRIWPAHSPERGQELSVLVDTGAAYTVVPRSILDAIGCLPSTKRTVVLPDGREEIWDLTYIVMALGGEEAPTPCLMGPSNGLTLLGAVTLEQFGLGVDPLRRRLIPVRAPIASHVVTLRFSQPADWSTSGRCSRSTFTLTKYSF